jgi:nitric oxide reductase subunit B
MLFALREIIPDRAWNGKLLNFSFWSLNGGLGLMLLCGLIPNGFYQLMQSVKHSTW